MAIRGWLGGSLNVFHAGVLVAAAAVVALLLGLGYVYVQDSARVAQEEVRRGSKEKARPAQTPRETPGVDDRRTQATLSEAPSIESRRETVRPQSSPPTERICLPVQRSEFAGGLRDTRGWSVL